MSDTPQPFSPPDCDLRGYDYMPLFGHRLFTSSLYTSSSGDEFRTAVRLWWSAWQQRPAGSLPNNDAELAMLADYGRDIKGWKKVRDTVLHGFILCNDGRLYHPMLCEEAVKAYEFRLKKDAKRNKERERLQRWRETRKERAETDKEDDSGNGNAASSESRDETDHEASPEAHDETRFTTRVETPPETPRETGNVVVDNTTQYKTREERTPKPPRGLVGDDDPGFDEFWGGYPRKDDKGHARKAWARARRKASAETIISGCRAYPFSENPRYVPMAATWLNGERWLCESENNDGMDPTLRAAGVTQDELDRYLGQITDAERHSPKGYLQ